MISEAEIIKYAQYFTDTVYSISDLSGFHNRVYLVKSCDDFILRISSAQHRSTDDTIGEIDFLLYLKANGASVASPLIGRDGNYVYKSSQGSYLWVISAYQIAEGYDWTSRGCDTDQRLILIGKTIGRIHNLSKAYKPTIYPLRRQWYEGQHLLKAHGLFAKYDPHLADVFLDYLANMKKLPREESCYSLIHGDFLFSNYHINGNDVTIFDFDECEYSWFIYDIAVCMYYYLLGGDPSQLSGKKEEAKETLFFLPSGYLQENEMDIYWIKNINLFFQMREFVLLSTIMEDMPETLDGWQKAFFVGALDRQLNHKAFIEVDLSQVMSRL